MLYKIKMDKHCVSPPDTLYLENPSLLGLLERDAVRDFSVGLSSIWAKLGPLHAQAISSFVFTFEF